MKSLTLAPRKASRTEMLAGVGGSFLVHIAACGVALMATWYTPHKEIKPPFCTVNLVSMQDIGSGVTAPKGDPRASEEAKVSDAPKPAAKAPGKSEPVVPVKRLHLDESAKQDVPIKKIEPTEAPKLAPSPQSLASVEKNLDKLIPKPKVVPKTSTAAEASHEPAKAASAPAQAPSAPATAAASNATGRPGKAEQGGQPAGRGTPNGSNDAGARGTAQGSTSGSLEGSSAASALLNLYAHKVREVIQQQWRLMDDQKAGGLKAVVEVQIRKTGEVINMQVVQPSGNSVFDQAAMRAVQRAAPLPAVPEVLVQSSTKLILTFRPGGVS